jgi:2-oxoisovalerate dehydrogenase E1 component
LTSDACERGSYADTLAAEVGEMAFDDLDAPVTVIGARNWIVPPTEMEASYLPQPEWLLDAIHTHLLPLSGYTPATSRTVQERIRRAQRGI